MSFKVFLLTTSLAAIALAANVASAESTVCDDGGATCVASCARFEEGDARRLACQDVCDRECASASEPNRPAPGGRPEARSYSKKGDALRERELNGKMIKAMSQGNLKEIRRLIEMNKGLNPTYAYDFAFNPDTREYEGTPVKLRLTDVFNDTVTIRGDEEGLDKILALFIELGMDVRATLPRSRTSDNPGAESTASVERTAWGPSLRFMERARDRGARMRAFELALERGLQPNGDVGEWLFAELPEICGRDRSEFAIQVVDLLTKHLGTTLQKDFWRMGERGPESVSDVLDRLMSPGRTPRSTYERNQFAEMDRVWENCAPLSRHINRYLKNGK